jgi:hypothetical protein
MVQPAHAPPAVHTPARGAPGERHVGEQAALVGAEHVERQILPAPRSTRARRQFGREAHVCVRWAEAVELAHLGEVTYVLPRQPDAARERWSLVHHQFRAALAGPYLHHAGVVAYEVDFHPVGYVEHRQVRLHRHRVCLGRQGVPAGNLLVDDRRIHHGSPLRVGHMCWRARRHPV